MKNFNFTGVHWKIGFLWGGHKKTIYRGELPKKGVAWTVCRFKGGLAKEGVLLRGVDTPMHTMVIQIELSGMKFVQKKSYEVAISEKNKLCENLKRVIDTKYRNFLEPVFSEYEMVWVQKQQEAGQITSF